MNRFALVGEPGARRVSPFLFVLVIVCFFLAFAGVSCNTDAAKTGLQAIGSASGVSAADTAAIDTCLDALKGKDVVNYSGWNLVFGRNPSIATLPASCETGTDVAANDVAQVNIGPQLLAILGLVSVLLALLCALAGSAGPAKGRSRALAAIIFGAGTGALLVLDHLHVRDVLLAKIAASAGSSVPGFNPTSYFSVNPGLGLVIAVIVLAVAVLYNTTALIIGSGPEPVAVAEGADVAGVPDVPPAPPPERSTLSFDHVPRNGMP
jgi:hypothetical protein